MNLTIFLILVAIVLMIVGGLVVSGWLYRALLWMFRS